MDAVSAAENQSSLACVIVKFLEHKKFRYLNYLYAHLQYHDIATFRGSICLTT